MHIRRPDLHARVVSTAVPHVAVPACKIPEVRAAPALTKPREAGTAPARGPSGTAR